MADERDFVILSQLRRNPFVSYENLGREVRLSGRSVKNRLEALETRGILTSLQAMPAAQVFGRQPRLYFFRGPASPAKLGRALEIDSVVFATLDVTGTVGVLVFHQPSSTAIPDGLETLLGSVSSEETPMFPYPREKLVKPVSLAELKVLGALVRDLRTSLKEISKSTDLSLKAVKRARRRLLDEGLFQVQPIFQSAQSMGILLFELHFRSEDPSVLARTRETLPRSTFVNQWEDGTTILSCWAGSIEEVYEIERRLRGDPGIDAAWVKFHAKTILATSRLSAWIDEKIAGTTKHGALS